MVVSRIVSCVSRYEWRFRAIFRDVAIIAPKMIFWLIAYRDPSEDARRMVWEGRLIPCAIRHPASSINLQVGCDEISGTATNGANRIRTMARGRACPI